jgi:hypothetical protein
VSGAATTVMAPTIRFDQALPVGATVALRAAVIGPIDATAGANSAAVASPNLCCTVQQCTAGGSSGTIQ